MMHSDSPPASWYEPADWIEDADPEEVAPATDDLVVVAGVCSWFTTLAHDDDTDDTDE